MQKSRRESPDGFPYESFPGFSGILQQYIFYYERLLQNKIRII